MHTKNAITKRILLTEKNKDLLTVNHKSVESKSFDGVAYMNLAKDMDLIQVANYMVSKKSEKRRTLARLCKVDTEYCV